jgi:hypothetical protein
MFTRRLLRIFILTALISAAIPLYQRFLQPSRPPGRGPGFFTAACTLLLVPGIWIAEAILPDEYLVIDPPKEYFAHRDLVVWSAVIPANTLFWTTVLMFMTFTIDRVRRRTGSDASKRAPGRGH